MEKIKIEIWKQIIMQEVAQELQIKKDFFCLERKVVKEQFQKMEEKVAQLDKKIDLFKAKEKKPSQY